MGTIIVYGSTPAGIAASIAAAREGQNVVLISTGQKIGGMMAGGLGGTDVADFESIGGLAREFFANVLGFYQSQYGPASQQVIYCARGYHFEPSVAEHVFWCLLNAQPRVTVRLGERLESVAKDGARIASISTDLATYQGDAFIDATYEGDLLAMAGVPFAIGRESSAEFGESLAGNRRILHAGETVGTGDAKVQSYTYRVCGSTSASRIPWTQPNGYNPAAYEWLAVALQEHPEYGLENVLTINRLPNGKCDFNNIDLMGGSWGYPGGDAAARAICEWEHERYARGYFWFLATDPRVPAQIREAMAGWGLPTDEFRENGNWSTQLYVREGRRMRGRYVLSQADCEEGRSHPDSIQVGTYGMDSHHVRREIADDGRWNCEGNILVHNPPFAVPYQVMTPLESDCSNLLVPVAISATHVAFGALRLEPNWMMLGQAAGIAAALAVSGSKSVQSINTEALRAKLHAAGIVTNPELIGPNKAIDDRKAVKFGAWTESQSLPGFIGPGYLHDGNTGKGDKSVVFNLKNAPGLHEVWIYFVPAYNRASNVPVTIAGQTILVDQRQAPGRVLLGVFDLPAEAAAVIGTEGTDGYVVADAVRAVPVWDA